MTNNATWRAENKDKVRAADKRHRDLYPERARERHIKHYTTKREILDKAKNVPCLRCGLRYPSFVMEFHHRDPSTKIREGRGNMKSVTLKNLEAEIAKCDVYCANCHRFVEHEAEYLVNL